MTEEQKTIKCPKCGTENDGNNNFCQLCGAKIKENITVDNQSKSNKKNIKKNLMFSFITEIVAFLIIVAFTAGFPVLEIIDVIGNRISDTENVYEQLYLSILFVEQSVVILIGLLFILALWSVFKFNRIEQRIVEMQNLAEPEPKQKLLTWFGFIVGIIIFVVLTFWSVITFVR